MFSRRIRLRFSLHRDHFQPWRHTGGHAPNSLAWLGALGASTSRIVMGTSVLTPTFRYHPSIVAQAFATLGVLFPGRVILGVGSGESLNETPSSGMAWPEPKERTARSKKPSNSSSNCGRKIEYPSAASITRQRRRLFTTGRTIRFPSTSLPPDRSSPNSPESAPRDSSAPAARSELYRDTLLPNVNAGLAKTGRSSDSIDRMIEMKVSFDTDYQRAFDDTRFSVVPPLPGGEDEHRRPPGMERLADSLPVERTAKRWIVSSDPEEQVEAIRPYVERGFNHLVFHAPGPDQPRFLKLYSEQVLPLLRRRFV